MEVEERALLKELGERLMVIVVNPNLNWVRRERDADRAPVFCCDVGEGPH